ncbi:phosphonate ABC transporter, permease protein PhnE [Pelagibius sp.]|uniref:phosphonate ABC transporter, permease protein PhnE n=1 Tax=Pelagibius sp. TaxID=1931238 RepID=UPI00261EEE9D|nr:phosphonate ABC transporter, permease protein PhnE [Pelagibius sp.]
MTDLTLSPSAASNDAVARFHEAYAAARRRKRLMDALFALAFIVCFCIAAVIGDLDPVKIWNGLPRLHEFIVKILPVLRWESFGADLAEWFLPVKLWLKLLVETILIAFLATVFGIIGAFVLSFPASRNLMPNRVILFTCRRLLEIARTVPELVYALIFVFCFGIGPMAGVLAIAVHTMGALGKLYSEVNENIDMKAPEGLRAAGANWVQMIRYAVVPQVLPNHVSYTLLRFEINVRSSSIIGFVGAGGLGQEIRTAISFQYYTDISALFLIILVTVASIDLICERVRHRFIGREGLA